MENPTDEVLETELKRRFLSAFLDLLILRLVHTQPTWGYSIIKKTEASYGVKLRHGALYPMLNTLENKLLDIFDDFLKEHISQGGIKTKEKTE